MYADPRFIRHRRVNLSLSELEDRLADVAAEYAGMQKSAFLRELILEGLQRVHAANDEFGDVQKRVGQ